MTNPLLRYLGRRDRLTDEEQQILEAACLHRKLVRARTDLVEEHSMPTYSTVLMSGFAARYSILFDGRRQISAIHIPGDFVDLHSFLLGRMDHGVAALSDCSIAQVPHDVLRDISENRPHLTRMLWLSTVIDAAIHRRWIVAAGRLPAEGQVAHLFCELYSRLEVVGLTTDHAFKLPISQIEFSDALGLSAVHLNRTLMEMRRTGLIEWRGSDVVILDWPRLKMLAEFNDTYLSLDTRPR